MVRTYCWLMARNAVVSLPRWRSLPLLLTQPLPHLQCRRFLASSPPLLTSKPQCILTRKERKFNVRAAKRKDLSNALEEKDLSHIVWWREKLQMCRKPSSISLVKRLRYTNLLGVDANLKNGRSLSPCQPLKSTAPLNVKDLWIHLLPSSISGGSGVVLGVL